MATSRMFSVSSYKGSDEVRERICSLCSKEDKDVDAVELCLDCEQFLCHSCSVQHGRFKPLQKHKVVQKDQVQNFSLSVSDGSETADFECTLCLMNGTYRAPRVYCLNCCKYLCSVCESDHNLFELLRDHEMKTVEEVRKEINESQEKESRAMVIAGKSMFASKLSCATCKRQVDETMQLWKCINCGFSNKCKECCEQHQSSHKDHRIIPFEEFKVIYKEYGKYIMSKSGEFIGPVCSKCCKKGAAKYPNMFCLECNIFVCISCKEDHASHRTDSHDKYMQILSAEIEQMGNIDFDCSMCLDRKLQSSASWYCLKCDLFICTDCLKLHCNFFRQFRDIQELQEINLRIAKETCNVCRKRQIDTFYNTLVRCEVCKIRLCHSCSGFHFKTYIGHKHMYQTEEENEEEICELTQM
jgi:hypothetical protein